VVDERRDGDPRPARLVPSEMRVGALLQLEAVRLGRGLDWSPYAAGRLLLPTGVEPPFGLLAELVPRDRAQSDVIAARWRVDPEVLWLVIRSALHVVRR